jgi:hypothetical protein
VGAFEVHRRLIDQFTEGLVDIHDQRIRHGAEAESAAGAQWSAPWSSLNPSFEPGGRVEEPVPAGLLGLEG